MIPKKSNSSLFLGSLTTHWGLCHSRFFSHSHPQVSIYEKSIASLDLSSIQRSLTGQQGHYRDTPLSPLPHPAGSKFLRATVLRSVGPGLQYCPVDGYCPRQCRGGSESAVTEHGLPRGYCPRMLNGNGTHDDRSAPGVLG